MVNRRDFLRSAAAGAIAMAPVAAERRKSLLLTIYLPSQSQMQFNPNTLKLYNKSSL